MRTLRLLLCCAVLGSCSRATGVGLSIAANRDGEAFASNAPTIWKPSLAHQPSRNVPRFKSLYSFKGGADGQYPLAGLVELNGTLFGTTNGFGAFGTVFKITKSGKETVLHNFTARSDGYGPLGGLTNINGMLYGTTESAGASTSCCGTIFKITPSGTKTVLYNFLGNPDGAGPSGDLLNINGILYGTTVSGGTSANGTVFEFTPSLTHLGTERVLHTFTGGSDGTRPFSAGVIGFNGELYGTTFFGGSSCPSPGCGTVFAITPTGTESVVYNFRAGNDGAEPTAALIAVDGSLYGTTYAGGPTQQGTVFKVTPSGAETVLHDFGIGYDGSGPSASLLAFNGALYGTTALGGASGSGTVFKVTLSGTESILYSFTGGADGAKPNASLIAVNGVLYGTTESGGATGNGTVFSLAL